MRRDKLQIILDILEICVNGANKTKIVYQANLNFKMVNIYLDILTNDQLLDMDSEQNKIYVTTNKGKELLKDVKQIYNKLENYSLDK
jgi:predicted transcriptional regulator